MGVRLSVLARCLAEGCTWSAAGPGSQADADRHLKRTGHPVTVVSRPEVPEQPYDRTVLAPPTEP